MSSSQSLCKESLRQQAMSLGAVACGFAMAGEVEAQALDLYRRWIEQGRHGSMDYCANYEPVRSDVRLLLPGAATVISCAFAYYTGECELPLAPHVARYAWGADYHWVIKQRLTLLGEYIKQRCGAEYRVCVDTAPIRERYWAEKSGVGYVGLNNQLIVPGVGSYCFLGELLTTAAIDPDEPCTQSCDGCGACVRACPGGALDGSGACDARRCLSYLTIEHRADLPAGTNLAAQYYGCDVCQRVCRHNANPAVTSVADFAPNEELLSLTVHDLRLMSSSRFRRLTAHSAMSRVPLKQLLRNIDAATEK